MFMTCPGPYASSFTIILPTYNEVQNIRCMVEGLLASYPGVNLLVVDDNSIDGTVEAMHRLTRMYPSVRLMVRNPADKGLTASLMDGIVNVRTKHFIVMDADFQHPVASVRSIMDELSAGHVLVVGTRNDIEALNATRRLASWGANVLARSYLLMHRRSRPHDLMSGFFGGDAAVWRDLILERSKGFERSGFKILFDLLKHSPRGISVAEVRYNFGERMGGESKLDSRVIVSLLRQCGYLGMFAAALIAPLSRRPARRSRDKDAVATIRP